METATDDKTRLQIRRIYAGRTPPETLDVDGSLYDGFLQDGDKRKFTDVRSMLPAALAQRDVAFKDPRLPELLFRYRARNWPESLSAEDAQRWNDYRRIRLTEDRGWSEFTFETHRAEIAALRLARANDGHAQMLLDQLQAWAQTLESELV